MTTLTTSISDTLPSQFIEEDLKSERARALFLKRSQSAQESKLVTFFLGHNTDCFAKEPVYGPTGKGFLVSRGVDGLNSDQAILDYLSTEDGKAFIKGFLNEVVSQIK